MEQWQEEVNKPYLSVSDEGIYNIIVKETPIKVENNFGKQQWMFENAEIGGRKGKFTPPKSLLGLISQALEDNGGEYPVKLTVKRSGISLDTKFTMQTKIEE